MGQLEPMSWAQGHTVCFIARHLLVQGQLYHSLVLTPGTLGSTQPGCQEPLCIWDAPAARWSCPWLWTSWGIQALISSTSAPLTVAIMTRRRPSSQELTFASQASFLKYTCSSSILLNPEIWLYLASVKSLSVAPHYPQAAPQ